jgi:hypothetical protein
MLRLSTPQNLGPDFRRLWIGQLLSTMGSQFAFITTPLVAYDLTHSGWFAGLMGSVNAALRLILGMPAAVVADRHNRRDLMLVADLARALAVGAFVLTLLLCRRFALIALVLMICVEGPMSGLFGPAEFAVIKRVVARAQWCTAFSRNEGRTWSASVVGPLIAGGLYSANAALPFLGNAVSYGASMLFVRGIPRASGEIARERERPAYLRRSTWSVGFHHVLHDHLLKRAVVQLAVHNAVLGGLTIVLVVSARQAEITPVWIGALATAQSAGALSGSFFSAQISRLLGEALTLAFTGLSWAVLVPVIVWIRTGPVVLAGLALLWFLVPSQRVALNTYLASTTEDEVQSRVLVTTGVLVGAIAPVGPLLGGLAVEAADPLAGALPLILLVVMALPVMVTTVHAVRHGPAQASPVSGP